MDNVIECSAERCVCEGGPTLSVLKDVQKAYEQRMELINTTEGSNKLQKQVELLQSWVSDLVGQNTLLSRTVEELETEVTSRMLLERRRHSEMESELRAEAAALRRKLIRKDSDLRGLLEVLRRLREFDYCTIDGIHFNEITESDIFGPVTWPQVKLGQGDSNRNHSKQHSGKLDSNRKISDKVNEMKMMNDTLKNENLSKDREIRRLNKDMQQCEQTIKSLRKEFSSGNYHPGEVSKKDAEVMADICFPGIQECQDVVPVKEHGELLRQESAHCQERMREMELSTKTSESVRSLRHVNVALREELRAVQRVCAALDEQCHAAALRAHFKDEVIHEMRRQLRQAKTKLKELSESNSAKMQKERENETGHQGSSYESLTVSCVQQQPRRKRRVRPDMDLNTNWDCRNPMYNGSGDDMSFKDE